MWGADAQEKAYSQLPWSSGKAKETGRREMKDDVDQESRSRRNERTLLEFLKGRRDS